MNASVEARATFLATLAQSGWSVAWMKASVPVARPRLHVHHRQPPTALPMTGPTGAATGPSDLPTGPTGHTGATGSEKAGATATKGVPASTPATASRATGSTGPAGSSKPEKKAIAQAPTPVKPCTSVVDWKTMVDEAHKENDIIVAGDEVARLMKTPGYDDALKLLGPLQKRYVTHTEYAEALSNAHGGALVGGKHDTASWSEIALTAATNAFMTDTVKLKLVGKEATAYKQTVPVGKFGAGFVTKAEWDVFSAKFNGEASGPKETGAAAGADGAAASPLSPLDQDGLPKNTTPEGYPRLFHPIVKEFHQQADAKLQKKKQDAVAQVAVAANAPVATHTQQVETIPIKVSQQQFKPAWEITPKL